MDQRITNLNQWVEEGYAPPEEVQIYPTNKCNLKCIFCCQKLNQYDFSAELTRQRWFEIAEELCDMGVKKILISGGGEPLLVPDTTLGIMNICKSNGLQGRLINNGTLWTEELATNTVKMQWDAIVFSVDSSNEGMHDKLRGVSGCFDKLMKSVLLFKNIKKNENKDKPRLEFNFVLNRLNYKNILGMIKLANKFKIDFLNFEPICLNNSEAVKLKLTKFERIKFMKHITPLAKDLSYKLNVATNLDRLSEIKVIEEAGNLDSKNFGISDDKKGLKLSNAACFEPWLWPKIEANGEVWPCSTTPLKTNIKNKSFREIWCGKEFEDFRNKILKRELSESCKNCVMTHLPVNNEIREKLVRPCKK